MYLIRPYIPSNIRALPGTTNHERTGQHIVLSYKYGFDLDLNPLIAGLDAQKLIPEINDKLKIGEDNAHSTQD